MWSLAQCPRASLRSQRQSVWPEQSRRRTDTVEPPALLELSTPRLEGQWRDSEAPFISATCRATHATYPRELSAVRRNTLEASVVSQPSFHIHCRAIDVFNVNDWLVVKPEATSTFATTSVPALTGTEMGFPIR